MPYKRLPTEYVKVMPIKLLPGVFASMQPVVCALYDAEYVRSPSAGSGNFKDFCVIKVKGKKVVMRRGEFVIIGG